jgi:hypothetical protein
VLSIVVSQNVTVVLHSAVSHNVILVIHGAVLPTDEGVLHNAVSLNVSLILHSRQLIADVDKKLNGLYFPRKSQIGFKGPGH